MSSPHQFAHPDFAIPHSELGDIETFPDNGLQVEGPPECLEKIWDYEPGGHHPVHLGDLLHERYKVLHKLGRGGYSNVWLCSDILVHVGQPHYVALNIMIAEVSTLDCTELRMTELVRSRAGSRPSSELFSFPLDRFEIKGPNGVHYVFVYPVLGPRVADLSQKAENDPKIPYKELCFQVVHALAALHEHGICHGGMFPVNHDAKRLLTIPYRFSTREYPHPPLRT